MRLIVRTLVCFAAGAGTAIAGGENWRRWTHVSIVDDAFHINGRPTYEDANWAGRRVEGLLLNARLVQGIFDDLNPHTVGRWAYPDTGTWDADRNTSEFVAAMYHWRVHGLLAFSLNLQGGCPLGYCASQPWINSAIAPNGQLRPPYMARLERVLDTADDLGMVVILGLFYFGQDESLRDESGVISSVDNVSLWLMERRYRNVLVEINNECNLGYEHAILQPPRVHELIRRVQSHSREGYRLLVGTSFSGGKVPTENVIRDSDFILLHGNGVGRPAGIRRMVQETRRLPAYRPMPILFNEDDHFDFGREDNNLIAALDTYASWGYFDPGQSNYHDGYQCPPVDWELNTALKREFFCKVSEITRTAATQRGMPDRCCYPDRAGRAVDSTVRKCGGASWPTTASLAVLPALVGLVW